MQKIFNPKLIVAALSVLCAVGAHAAGINKGFYKKAAQKVWAMDSEGLFQARKLIPDSIAADQSAVVIARHDDFVGDRVEQNTIYSETGRTNRTVLHHVERSMVKLLDAGAVERFSEFEFGGEHDRHSYGIEPIRRTDRTFGARIHKPDGSVREVDSNEALEVSVGKKGDKQKSYRLAIPGLEVGDVIEYFYYTEYENDEGDIELVDVMLADRYPILSQLVTGRFDPTLTVELKAYNGAPSAARTKVKDDNGFRIFCENMPAVSFRQFIFEESQLPFVRLNTINNHDLAGTFTIRARSARGAGIYQNIAGERIQFEAMENTAKLAHYLWKRTKPISQTPSKATKMVKDYAKAHPEATPRDLADAAWLAVRYHNFTTKDDDVSSSILLSMFHNDVVERLDVFPRDSTGIALANGRDEVSIQEISKWNQATFMSLVGDTTYFMQPAYYYAPGEMPGTFQGVSAVRITGRLRDLTYGDSPEYYNLADRRFNGNKAVFNTTVRIDADEPGRLNVSRHAVLTGTGKAQAPDFTDRMEWIASVEDYFGIPENKRYSDKLYSADERKKELATAVSDECLANLGVRPDSVLAFNITSRGCLPGQPTMEYTVDCTVPDMVEDLGDGMSVALGRLLGRHIRLDNHERERLLDAMLTSARTVTHLLTLAVPEGYEVDPTSLESFNRQVANAVGQFVVIAKVNDDGDIEVQCIDRLRHHSVALQAWPMLRDLCDAAADFADASVILTKN